MNNQSSNYIKLNEDNPLSIDEENDQKASKPANNTSSTLCDVFQMLIVILICVLISFFIGRWSRTENSELNSDYLNQPASVFQVPYSQTKTIIALNESQIFLNGIY